MSSGAASPRRTAKRKAAAVEATPSPSKLKRESTMTAVVKDGARYLERAKANVNSPSPARPAKRAKRTEPPQTNKKTPQKEDEEEEEQEEVNQEEEEVQEAEEEKEENAGPKEVMKGAEMLKVAKEAQHFLLKGSGSPMGKTRSQSAKAKQEQRGTPKKLLVKQSTMADTTQEGNAFLAKTGGSPATRLRPIKKAKGKAKKSA